MRKEPQWFYPYLLIVALFLCLIAPKILSEGMFFDGVTYAAISNNLANGIGSFWKPFYTEYLYAEFYEHPPIALGLEALLYKFFGSSIYVERAFSFINILLTILLTTWAWQLISRQKFFSFLPMMFLLLNGTIIWAATNNMLESTMMNFLLLGLIFFIKSTLHQKILNEVICGLFILLAFLTKGPTALYIWSLPFWYYLLHERTSFIRAIFHSIKLFVLTIVPLLLLFILVPASYEFMNAYVNIQIVGSLKKIQTVSTRFYIVYNFVSNIAVPILALVGIYFYNKKKKIKLENKGNRIGWALIITAVCGVLPVMISMKQSGHYILTVYPFFALGTAMIIVPYIKNIQPNKSIQRGIRVANLFLLLVSLALLISGYQKTFRDKELVQLVHTIKEKKFNSKQLMVSQPLFRDYPLHAYLMRYNNISIGKDSSLTYKLVKGKIGKVDPAQVILQSHDFYIIKRK